MNPRTLLYALGLTLVAGILFAVVPAIQSTRHNLVRALKDEGGSQSPRHRGRDILVVAQVALSLALLVSAGLLLRSASHGPQKRKLRPAKRIGTETETAVARLSAGFTAHFPLRLINEREKSASAWRSEHKAPRYCG